MSEALAEHPAPPPPRFVADLDTLIRARYPLIYLVSWEEQRLDGILQDLAAQHGKVLFAWSVTRGLRRIGGARAVPHLDPQKSPVEMLATLGKLGEPSLVVLKDFHPFLSDPQVVRALRELAQDLKSTYTTVILLSPVLQIPVELEKELSVLDVPLPAPPTPPPAGGRPRRGGEARQHRPSPPPAGGGQAPGGGGECPPPGGKW